ncbi:MAG TPA: HAD family hydrolase [Thermoanaerobaculia bacterium]|nr:HAD family hydrolase [Thermoanaerobaculia bacterium]
MIHAIGFDADDTLWHNMPLFSATEEKFKQMLSPYHPPDWVEQRLYQTEIRNLQHFGYGIKGFTLSMIETAIELTEGRIRGEEIANLIEWAREMLTAPVELLDHVEPVVRGLCGSYQLLLITKGDLFDQESKLARSGIGDCFAHVEIVSRKAPEVYRRILDSRGIDPSSFLMVGDSLRSDVLPVVEIGGQAVFIPPRQAWAHEVVPDAEASAARFFRIDHLGLLSSVIEQLEDGGPRSD